MTDDWRENARTLAFVDVALLGFIRAHQSIDDERKRLNDAKRALFGIDAGRGRPKSKNMSQLAEMTEKYVNERGVPTEVIGPDGSLAVVWKEPPIKKPTSVHELATQAFNRRRVEAGVAPTKGKKSENEADMIRLLEDKFSAEKDALIVMHVMWGSNFFNFLADSQLQELKSTLDALGIPFVAPTRPDREINSSI